MNIVTITDNVKYKKGKPRNRKKKYFVRNKLINKCVWDCSCA